MAAVAVIPARFASTRLPGKPLLKKTGKYLLQHVFEGCQSARRIERTIVATDDSRIQAAATSFEAEAVMTSPDHPSGSDRVAEVARELETEIIVNVQGDEVEIDGVDLDLLVEALEADPQLQLATLATPLRDASSWHNPHIVKVVVDQRSRALYFSRSCIPHGGGAKDCTAVLKHRGIYAFRRTALLSLAALPPTELEKTERLEQLRALGHGYPIHVTQTPRDGIEVNTPEDYQRFVKGEPA
jgi:3-deoxy-manno-octulosonate cytidylyltransferase (CMP-KDO synthetase)